MLKICLIGNPSRLHCLSETFARSQTPHTLALYTSHRTAALSQKSKEIYVGTLADVEAMHTFIQYVSPDLVFIAPEEPLHLGIVDRLHEDHIPCIGPTRALAQLESSKLFTRKLLEKYAIGKNPQYEIFYNTEEAMLGLAKFLAQKGDCVLKPDCLTGGKGVRMYREHFSSFNEAVAYCREVFNTKHCGMLVEEKLEGEEFSLQSFCDGKTLQHTPLVQDHKRLLVGDEGSMTGGMGSYSDADHGLPFLSLHDIEAAKNLSHQVFRALQTETSMEYHGILYGSFIRTKEGIQIIEFNVRFGDPEMFNVLPLLETDFVDVCFAIVDGTLAQLPITYAPCATVCKYLVSSDYPFPANKGECISLLRVPKHKYKLRTYHGDMICQSPAEKRYILGDSRALAFVGIDDTITYAERKVQQAIDRVTGMFTYRKDIGTAEAIQQKIDNMSNLLRAI